MGRPIYERYGFVQMGDLLEVDLKDFGFDTIFTMCKVAYFPPPNCQRGLGIVRE
jgi:hypothetical protein